MNVRSALLVTGSLILLASGCAAPSPGLREQPSPDTEGAYASHPDWSGRPVSWTKLSDIEDWLSGTGPDEYPEYVPQAELELAEGRLVLAQREAKGLPPPVLAARLNSAEAAFKRLLEEDMKPSLKLRAERGLSQIHSLRHVSTTAARAAAPADEPAGLAIQSRASWKAASADRRRMTAANGAWTRITIHHSAKYSRDIGSLSAGNVAGTIHDIQTVHMRDETYGDIGYHFLIDPTGRIWQGRSLEWQGAHASGANNVGNIGVCLLGDFNHERPDPRALGALEKLVDSLSERYRIPRSKIYGHRQMRNTECPGDALMAWVSRYSSGATE